MVISMVVAALTADKTERPPHHVPRIKRAVLPLMLTEGVPSPPMNHVAPGKDEYYPSKRK